MGKVIKRAKKKAKSKPKVSTYIRKVKTLRAYIRECIEETYSLGIIDRTMLLYNSDILYNLQNSLVACDMAIKSVSKGEDVFTENDPAPWSDAVYGDVLMGTKK